MQHVDDDATIVQICPSCQARARALALPEMKGLRITSVVIPGADGGERWTVMVNRGHKVLATGSGGNQDGALLEALEKLGVLR